MKIREPDTGQNSASLVTAQFYVNRIKTPEGFFLADQIRILRPTKKDDQSQIVHIPHEFVSLKALMGHFCPSMEPDHLSRVCEMRS